MKLKENLQQAPERLNVGISEADMPRNSGQIPSDLIAPPLTLEVHIEVNR